MTVGVSNWPLVLELQVCEEPWILLISGNPWGKLIYVDGKVTFWRNMNISCQILPLKSAFESHLFSDNDLCFLSNTFTSVFINNQNGKHLAWLVNRLSLTQEYELPDHFTEKCLSLLFHRSQSFRNELLFYVGCIFRFAYQDLCLIVRGNSPMICKCNWPSFSFLCLRFLFILSLSLWIIPLSYPISWNQIKRKWCPLTHTTQMSSECEMLKHTVLVRLVLIDQACYAGPLWRMCLELITCLWGFSHDLFCQLLLGNLGLRRLAGRDEGGRQKKSWLVTPHASE